ncbi:class I fructose-bisphosphate aldolase [Paenibacillus lutrae]|uniref:Deoxyribose-phosphate aldolase n=1 Tax=Paenibacillus lutrae TaxID=2078573 RepID=A0A7X3FNE7_9BACL|nr:deoxyribose-phosphate aldolase [Paenibacillus lutrae]MVP02584.1 deoxyribose-phosphate aldolase [Paenibacillus lutrae]
MSKLLRLSKLFHPKSGRSLMLPVDHGTTYGPLRGLSSMPELVRIANRFRLQALIAHKGAIHRALEGDEPAWGTEFILHLSASTTLGPDPSRKQIVSTVRHGLQIGAAGISVHVNVGVPQEHEMIRDLGIVCDEAYAWGMPVLAMMNVQEDTSSLSATSRKIAHAVRLAGELGADLVKIQNPSSPEAAAEVVSAFDIPVLLAGGNSTTDKLAFFRGVQEMLDAGGRGLCVGRNLFEDPHPSHMCQALSDLVHKRCSPEEAYNTYSLYEQELVLTGNPSRAKISHLDMETWEEYA